TRAPVIGPTQVCPSVSHSALQPSPEMLLLSSHCSPSFAQRLPSPQRSNWQAVHPSHATAFPSSHCSPACVKPSPQLWSVVVEVFVVVVVVVVVVTIAGH